MEHITSGLCLDKDISPVLDIVQLEIIADWRQELTAKIRRARMRFELVGLDNDSIDQLSADVAAFRQVCRCLTRLREMA